MEANSDSITRKKLLDASDKFISRKVLERHCKVHYETKPEDSEIRHLRVAIAACFFDVYRLDKEFLKKHEVKFITGLNNIMGQRTVAGLFLAKYLQTK